jgi:hypothetical protein
LDGLRKFRFENVTGKALPTLCTESVALNGKSDIRWHFHPTDFSFLVEVKQNFDEAVQGFKTQAVLQLLCSMVNSTSVPSFVWILCPTMGCILWCEATESPDLPTAYSLCHHWFEREELPHAIIHTMYCHLLASVPLLVWALSSDVLEGIRKKTILGLKRANNGDAGLQRQLKPKGSTLLDRLEEVRVYIDLIYDPAHNLFRLWSLKISGVPLSKQVLCR